MALRPPVRWCVARGGVIAPGSRVLAAPVPALFYHRPFFIRKLMFGHSCVGNNWNCGGRLRRRVAPGSGALTDRGRQELRIEFAVVAALSRAGSRFPSFWHVCGVPFVNLWNRLDFIKLSSGGGVELYFHSDVPVTIVFGRHVVARCLLSSSLRSQCGRTSH